MSGGKITELLTQNHQTVNHQCVSCGIANVINVPIPEPMDMTVLRAELEAVKKERDVLLCASINFLEVSAPKDSIDSDDFRRAWDILDNVVQDIEGEHGK